MKVVLFCGGQGLRMRGAAYGNGGSDLPKPMVPLGTRPILWHLMKYYAHFGHTDFILCLGYKGATIKEFFAGYHEDPATILSKTFKDVGGYDDIVLVKDIPFSSHCEHHMVPFFGKAHIAYLPHDGVVGISKLARLVEVFSKRLQVQEVLTAQIIDAINEHLNPRGAAVMLEAEHMCMSIRGVRAHGAQTVTQRFTGVFAEETSEQDRFFQMDYRRHVTAGRLSELVGADKQALEADKVVRTLGWHRVAEQEWGLLDATTNPAQRKAMLAGKVEDMINTVVRQIAFYTFEREVHTERRNGELTAERLCEIWLSVQRESLGAAIDIKPGYETFWTYIGHFIHAPFYVYAYAFGDCLVNSLYAVYEKSHQGFAERYLQMLAAGGTKHHSELLEPFGLDARDPAFWQGGLGMIERMIGELEGLA